LEFALPSVAFALAAGGISPLPCAGVVVPPAGALALSGATGEAAGCAGVASASPETTEREPVTMGNESVSATSMKSAAATIVILARMVCVPRGPNAVLETELVKSAPASAFPGCNRTETIITMQESIKSPYKK